MDMQNFFPSLDPKEIGVHFPFLRLPNPFAIGHCPLKLCIIQWNLLFLSRQGKLRLSILCRGHNKVQNDIRQESIRGLVPYPDGNKNGRIDGYMNHDNWSAINLFFINFINWW